MNLVLSVWLLCVFHVLNIDNHTVIRAYMNSHGNGSLASEIEYY